MPDFLLHLDLSLLLSVEVVRMVKMVWIVKIVKTVLIVRAIRNSELSQPVEWSRS